MDCMVGLYRLIWLNCGNYHLEVNEMGWKGHEIEIPAGMIFKKMYCHKCGNKLKIKKVSNVHKKGDSNYSNKILGHATIGMDRIEKVNYIYWCPKCNSEITYEDQCAIAKSNKKN